MDGRCLDDAADRAFGTEPDGPQPPRRRFRRRPLRRFLPLDRSDPSPEDDEPEDDQP